MSDDQDSGHYERDFATWAMSQAQALRAMRGVALNREERSTDLLRAMDWEHLAGEIEGLARRQRQDLAQGLQAVVEHLVRLEFSPACAPRAAWIATLWGERD